jgi:hypothetical protein
MISETDEERDDSNVDGCKPVLGKVTFSTMHL